MSDQSEGIITEIDAAMSALNERQQKFVELIVAGVPQTEAAKRAGYAHKHAASTASHLRRDPKVQRALVAQAELQVENDETGGLELVEKRLLEISATGTAAARVSSLAALQKLYESRAARPEESAIERYKQMPAEEREMELFERFHRIVDRMGQDEQHRDRVRAKALEIRELIDARFA